METNRTKALKELAGAMPIASQKAAQQLQAGRLVGLQQAVSQAQGPVTKQQIQQGAAQQVTQAAGIQNQVANNMQGNLVEMGRASVQAQQTAQQTQLDGRRLALAESSRKAEESLNSLGADLKQKLFDRQMQFEKDEAGRALFNTTQLADWAVQKSKNAEEYKNKVQKMDQAHKMTLHAMEITQKKIEQQLEFEMRKKIQDRDQATLERLARYKQQLRLEYEKKVAKYKNEQAQWQAGGMVVGAIIGTMAGGNTAAGAAIGGSAGTIIYSQTHDEPTQ
jgi:hypothetical protein